MMISVEIINRLMYHSDGTPTTKKGSSSCCPQLPGEGIVTRVAKTSTKIKRIKKEIHFQSYIRPAAVHCIITIIITPRKQVSIHVYWYNSSSRGISNGKIFFVQ